MNSNQNILLVSSVNLCVRGGKERSIKRHATGISRQALVGRQHSVNGRLRWPLGVIRGEEMEMLGRGIGCSLARKTLYTILKYR